MISISSTAKRATRKLSKQQKKQIPFALSNTINDLAFQARKAEQNSQRQQIDGPTPFTQKGFQVKKSNKRSLEGRISIPPNRWKYIQKITRGGSSSRQGKAHSVPINQALSNKYGNLPRNKARTLSNRKNHFIATINGTAGVWKRNKDGSLSLQIVFKRSITIPKSYVPWRATNRIVNSKAKHIFKKKLEFALRTAR